MSATGTGAAPTAGTAAAAGGARNDTPATAGGAAASTGNNRNQNRRNGRNNNRNAPRVRNTSTFKGKVPEMNGHVFQCHGEATEKNQFASTMEELSSYVGLHFKHHPADIKRMINPQERRTRTPNLCSPPIMTKIRHQEQKSASGKRQWTRT